MPLLRVRSKPLEEWPADMLCCNTITVMMETFREPREAVVESTPTIQRSRCSHCGYVRVRKMLRVVKATGEGWRKLDKRCAPTYIDPKCFDIDEGVVEEGDL
jgi:hypothetical protein